MGLENTVYLWDGEIEIYGHWRASISFNERDVTGSVKFIQGSRDEPVGLLFSLRIAPVDYPLYVANNSDRLLRQAIQQCINEEYFSKTPKTELVQFDSHVEEWCGEVTLY